MRTQIKMFTLFLFFAVSASAEDWNTPTTTTNYSSVLTKLKARDVSCAKMDYSADTNIPTGVIRWNGTSKKFESWSGSAWSDIYPEIAAHLASTANPHSTTAAQVGAPTTATFNAHANSTSNPHSTTAAQVGALAISSNLNDLGNKATARTNLSVPAISDLSAHTSNTSNPHSVTTTQISALNKNNNLSDVTNASIARSNIDAAESGSNSDISALNTCSYLNASSANLTLRSQPYGSYVEACPSQGTNGCWQFIYTGKIKPPLALQPDYGSFGSSPRRSINPAAATTQQVAEAVDTIITDMIAAGYFR